MVAISIPEDCFIKRCIRMKRVGEKRWCSDDRSMIYTWDSLHGEIEVYNDRGRHLGVMDCSENYVKPAVRGRKIDV